MVGESFPYVFYSISSSDGPIYDSTVKRLPPGAVIDEWEHT